MGLIKDSGIVTVEEVIREGLRDSELHNKPATLRADTRAAGHLARLLGRTPARRLNVAAVEKYQSARKAEGVGPKTINLETDFLRHAWNVCLRKDLFGANPPANPIARRLERLRTPKFNPRIYTADEWGMILAAAREEDYRLPALVTLAYRIGLTKQDLGAIQWKDINLVERLVAVPEGKRDPVVVPLDEECIRELVAMRAGGKVVTLGPIFPFGWLAQDGNARPIQRIAEATGLPVTLHGLRHNAATRLAGVNALVAQRILRHKDLRTTERYAHFSTDHFRAVVEEAASKHAAGA